MFELRLRKAGMCLVDFFTALIGTAVLEFPIGKAIRAQMFPGQIWREWVLTILVGGALGFLVFRMRRSETSKFAFAASIFWVVFIIVPITTFNAHLPPLQGSLWYYLSGNACSIERSGCLWFFLVSIPLIRGFAYSAGAFLASKPRETGPVVEATGPTHHA